jgi:hypothetical protein
MKLSGTDSCISMALMKTKSPSVCVAALDGQRRHHHHDAVPAPKITAWPKFSQPSEVQTWVAERS